MLCVCFCLVLGLVAPLVGAQHVAIAAVSCAGDQLVANSPYNETFQVAIDESANRQWRELVLSVLVSNRTDHLLLGYAAPHRIRFDRSLSSRWSVRLDQLQTVDGTLTYIRIDRDSTEASAVAFNISVHVLTDRTGCFNVSGLGIMTRVRFESSDALGMDGGGVVSAMCTHEQDPRCVEWYKPVVREREICGLCYMAFILFVFGGVYILSR